MNLRKHMIKYLAGQAAQRLEAAAHALLHIAETGEFNRHSIAEAHKHIHRAQTFLWSADATNMAPNYE